MQNIKFYEKDFIYLALIFLASVAVFSPILIYGVPYPGTDFIHHLQLGNSFYNGLEHGVLYPNWVMEENSGYGSVVIRFYPPLIEYSLAVFRLLSGNWQMAIFSTFAFWSFIGSTGIYLWTREFFSSKWQASVAGILFALAPYRISQVYHSSMFGEYAAMSVLPFALYFVLRICRNGKIYEIAGFAVSVALLILSNLPQTVIGILMIGAYTFCNLKKPQAVKQISQLAVGALLGLAASAFYWVRMFREMSFINVAQPNLDPDYDYHNNFLLGDFVLDARGIWFASLMFAIAVLIVLFLTAVTKNFKSIRRDKNIFNVAVLFISAIFMGMRFSTPIWDNLVFLQKVQFPFRFLSVITICTSVLAAYCLKFINIENYRKKRPIILIIVGVLLIYSMSSVRQVALGGSVLDSSSPDTTVESLLNRKGLWHWFPTWAGEKIFEQGNNIEVSGRDVEVKKWETEQREFTVSGGEPAKDVRLPILFYPHWQATINDQPVGLHKSDDGAMAIDLPSGEADVKIFFVEPASSLWSRKISIFAWLMILLLVPFDLFRRGKTFID